MNIAKDQFATVAEVLRDVTTWNRDTEHRKHTKGYYIRLIQQALEELSFDFSPEFTFFTVDIPSTLRADLPDGTFNLKNIYLFNGAWCQIEDAPNVYWKKDYWQPGGGGIVAKSKQNSKSDPFYVDKTLHNPRYVAGGGQIGPDNARGQSSLYFYNIQEGQIHFSPTCSQYERALLEISYVRDLNNDPVIPNFLRDAVTLWAAKRALSLDIDADQSAPARLAAVTNDLEGRRHESEGAWYKAELRVKRLDNKARRDLYEYYSRLAY